jgi:hypothetical protein
MENNLSDKKFRKWGWGWYILAGIVSLSINKPFPGTELKHSITYLLGVSFSILMYFYFRNKVFRNYNKFTLRSTFSGLISYVLTVFFVAAVASFGNVLSSDILSTVSKNISSHTQKVSSKINEFKKEETLLWEFFVDEPSTDNEISNNIKIIEKSIPLHKTVDSIALATFTSIHNTISEAEKNYPERMKLFPINSEMLLTIIDKLKKLSSTTINKFTALKSYYNSELNGKTNSDELWESYLIAEENYSIAENEYSIIMNEFIRAQNQFIDK